METKIRTLKQDFNDEETLDKVLHSGESLTLIFNDGVSRDDAKEAVSQIVFEEHELEYPDEVHLVTVPEQVRRKNDDMMQSRQSIIVADVDEYTEK